MILNIYFMNKFSSKHHLNSMSPKCVVTQIYISCDNKSFWRKFLYILKICFTFWGKLHAEKNGVDYKWTCISTVCCNVLPFQASALGRNCIAFHCSSVVYTFACRVDLSKETGSLPFIQLPVHSLTWLSVVVHSLPGEVPPTSSLHQTRRVPPSSAGLVRVSMHSPWMPLRFQVILLFVMFLFELARGSGHVLALLKPGFRSRSHVLALLKPGFRSRSHKARIFQNIRLLNVTSMNFGCQQFCSN